jgi:hypothetical protein
MTTPEGEPVQTEAATSVSGQISTTFPPTAEIAAAPGPYTLAISNNFVFYNKTDITKFMVGESLTASPGKVWIGTGNGTIEEVESQSGTFLRSIPITQVLRAQEWTSRVSGS